MSTEYPTLINKYDSEIHVTQRWADNDLRNKGRVVRITALDPDTRKAQCLLVTEAGGKQVPNPTRSTQIGIDRLRKTNTGYFLLGCDIPGHCGPTDQVAAAENAPAGAELTPAPNGAPHDHSDPVVEDIVAGAPVLALRRLLDGNCERYVELLAQHLNDLDTEVAGVRRELLAGETPAHNRLADIGAALARAAAVCGQLTTLRTTAAIVETSDQFTARLAQTAARILAHEPDA
ncbi:hypothetical protein ACIGO9_30020 [Nocardia asteroides]|uniref:hypothetical protein n=1 Tax=Nocardia asteroides TaxID=1824 RepID=UPI0037CBC9B2